MAELMIGMDMLKPIGLRFGSLVRAEIEYIAPSTVNDNSITEPKFFDGAVSTRAIADDAVTSDKIADGGIETLNLADDSVTGAKIHADSIGPSHLAAGVPSFRDFSGNAISAEFVTCTAAEFASLPSPDAGTWYLIEG